MTSSVFCRVCGSTCVSQLDFVEFYKGYAWPIFDCNDCFCRFTWHNCEIYDLLHADNTSRYAEFREYAAKCQTLFSTGDVAGLRLFLTQSPKTRFIIDTIEQRFKYGKLLEIGCSRGYLTSYFIAAGYDVRGIDISHEALTAAKTAFGQYFFPIGSPEIFAQAPYHAIYHQGTIGCVEDPIDLTESLLEMLRPGGLLVFNAPNADACWLKGQPWVDTAPPPDVVTLFRKGFWKNHFHDAEVEEVVHCDDRKALQIFWARLIRRRWRKATALPLLHRTTTSLQPAVRQRRLWTRVVGKTQTLLQNILIGSGAARLLPPAPTEFGLHVIITKKQLPHSLMHQTT